MPCTLIEQQTDNVLNQREHLVLLLANSQSHLGSLGNRDSDASLKVHPFFRCIISDPSVKPHQLVSSV